MTYKWYLMVSVFLKNLNLILKLNFTISYRDLKKKRNKEKKEFGTYMTTQFFVSSMHKLKVYYQHHCSQFNFNNNQMLLSFYADKSAVLFMTIIVVSLGKFFLQFNQINTENK